MESNKNTGEYNKNKNHDNDNDCQDDKSPSNNGIEETHRPAGNYSSLTDRNNKQSIIE